jgi:hypothetical protein
MKRDKFTLDGMKHFFFCGIIIATCLFSSACEKSNTPLLQGEIIRSWLEKNESPSTGIKPIDPPSDTPVPPPPEEGKSSPGQITPGLELVDFYWEPMGDQNPEPEKPASFYAHLLFRRTEAFNPSPAMRYVLMLRGEVDNQHKEILNERPYGGRVYLERRVRFDPKAMRTGEIYMLTLRVDTVNLPFNFWVLMNTVPTGDAPATAKIQRVGEIECGWWVGMR